MYWVTKRVTQVSPRPEEQPGAETFGPSSAAAAAWTRLNMICSYQRTGYAGWGRIQGQSLVPNFALVSEPFAGNEEEHEDRAVSH